MKTTLKILALCLASMIVIACERHLGLYSLDYAGTFEKASPSTTFDVVTRGYLRASSDIEDTTVLLENADQYGEKEPDKVIYLDVPYEDVASCGERLVAIIGQVQQVDGKVWITNVDASIEYGLLYTEEDLNDPTSVPQKPDSFEPEVCGPLQ